MKKPELRALRRKIGMVFQQFNLLESKTVYHNIALPLILAKTPKVEIDKKVKEVLKIVELEDKKDTYARFDYEVVFSLLLPQKTCGVSATGFTQKRHTM